MSVIFTGQKKEDDMTSSSFSILGNMPYSIPISSTSNTSTEPAGIAPWARLP